MRAETGERTSVDYLASRFRDLWTAAAGHGRNALGKARGKARGKKVWQDLYGHYQEKHRRYHNADHIAFCLCRLDPVITELDNPRAVELALWFHDAIYDPYARDNEKRSVEYFADAAQGTLDPELVAAVGRLIIITEHRQPPGSIDEQFICDIDLSSFAVPWEHFLKDCNDLRSEQDQLSDAIYYGAKLRFLKSLLERPRIFQTERFYRVGETPARANIRHFIDLIETKLAST